jgi:hypothetical protein
MTATIVAALLTDLVCIAVLAFALYHRRHGRRDLLLAFIALNTGVLVVTLALTSVDTGIGLGLGLFGILSIIRLRSDQIAQEEVAYYFTALALGLLAGLHPGAAWTAPVLSLGLLLVIAVVDHPRVLRRSRRVVMTLDAAYPDERRAAAAAGALLGATVRQVVVQEVDLVRDVTVVDVRYSTSRAAARSTAAAPSSVARTPAAGAETGSVPELVTR